MTDPEPSGDGRVVEPLVKQPQHVEIPCVPPIGRFHRPPFAPPGTPNRLSPQPFPSAGSPIRQPQPFRQPAAFSVSPPLIKASGQNG
ncbi:hypothetical protein GCM10010255_15730 [Streptomyces coeruleofuscus]|uniref:Uncharacterized protein n=1 Tax=Streptomyces coeruleofuscus TaxID=66879 RepID=A0ABN3HV48_9ACTN